MPPIVSTSDGTDIAADAALQKRVLDLVRPLLTTTKPQRVHGKFVTGKQLASMMEVRVGHT
jgi:hypothetical protein